MPRERTHWEGCWRERTHHDCALVRIAALEAELAERTWERDDERKRREDAGAELAAERERRRAVEKDAVRCQGLRAAQRDTLDEKSRLISAMGSRNSMLDAELAAERERRKAAEDALRERPGQWYPTLPIVVE